MMAQPILTNPQELETWLDELMAEQMNKLHIPGVTFSLVQNGELFLAKGYGYADLEEQIPVVADTTVFGAGGNAKLLTATAIMQLAEKGLLNLDDDVNQYLQDFQIDNKYSRPITIANLLTHTDGLEGSAIGMGTLKASDIIPIEKYLAKQTPQQVRSPGEVLIGANHGYGLLGYVVESVSNISFSQYISENILQPLKMNSSSVELPSHLAANLAKSYRYKEKQQAYQALPFNHFHLPSMGSLNSTATDMAKFATAHLQYGRFESQRILSEATARQMQQQQFTNNPRLPGVGFGFWEYLGTQDGEWAIAHSGGIVAGFRSLLYLLPNYNLGFFVAQNGSNDLSSILLKEFLDRYFSSEDYNQAKYSLQNQNNLKRYEGSYRSSSYPQLTLSKSFQLFYPASFRLKAETEDTLTIPKNPDLSFKAIEPLLLAEATNRQNFVAAKENDRGEITDLFYGMGKLKKLAWHETSIFHWILSGCFAIVFLSGSAFSILSLAKLSGDSGQELIQLLIGLTCELNLTFIVAITLVFRSSCRFKFLYGMPKIVALLLCIPLISSILALGLTVLVISALINQQWSTIEQVYCFIVTLFALGFIPFLNYWNLLGFRY